MSEKWFYEAGGMTKGPLRLNELERMIEKGAIKEHTLVWHKRMAEWAPAEKVETLQNAVERSRRVSQVVGVVGGSDSGVVSVFPPPRPQRYADEPSRRPAPRKRQTISTEPAPWRRYLARSIDVCFELCLTGLFGALFVMALGIDAASTQGGAVAVIMWMVVGLFGNAYLHAAFGASLGKWICGLRVVRRNGDLLTFSQAIARNIGVFFIGYGAFILSPITMLFSFQRLLREGATYWDHLGGFEVERTKIDPVRIIVGVIVTLICVPFTVTVIAQAMN